MAKHNCPRVVGNRCSRNHYQLNYRMDAKNSDALFQEEVDYLFQLRLVRVEKYCFSDY
jgi:hypothetical protein